MTAVHLTAQVHSVQRAGAYQEITILAPPIAQQARPGQFLTVAVGGSESALLLRRSFAIAGVEEWGIPAGRVRFVVAVHGRGTAWLSGLRPGESVDVVGPLGRPFRLPKSPVGAVLVGGGYGSAPLIPLADALRVRAARIDTILGAATRERLYAVEAARGVSHRLHVTTEDGTAGSLGQVTDALEDVLEAGRTDVIYACGPMPMLAAVADIAEREGLPCQVSVEESMACGIGVCMTCVLPVRGSDGVTRMVRSCVDGPVFPGEAVRFADVGTVPPETLGADAMLWH